MKDDLRIHDSVEALVADAADWFLRRIASAQQAGRQPHVALTGGSLAPAFHEGVARRAGSSGADLHGVHWWWGDERFVAAASPERNDLSGTADLLAPHGVPEEHIHRVPSTDDAATVEEAAELYAGELRRLGVTTFEVVVLGLGPDGHVASLFPGHPGLAVTDTDTVAVRNSPKPPPLRVSLTLPMVRRARAVLLMAAGSGKAEAVATARQSGPLTECPARGARGTEETVWCLDRDAATSLPHSI